MTVGLEEGGCIEGFRRVKFGEVGGGMNASGGEKGWCGRRSEAAGRARVESSCLKHVIYFYGLDEF